MDDWTPAIVDIRLENAADVFRVKTFGVDVSSGVETAPGKKNQQAVRDFIANVRKAGKP